jgi:membrane protein implicated in regulation of membrane protease activity
MGVDSSRWRRGRRWRAFGASCGRDDLHRLVLTLLTRVAGKLRARGVNVLSAATMASIHWARPPNAATAELAGRVLRASRPIATRGSRRVALTGSTWPVRSTRQA